MDTNIRKDIDNSLPTDLQNPISSYPTISDISGEETMPLSSFLDGVKEGTWQDIVIPIRALADKKDRAEAKKKAPAVTIAGVFAERKDAGLTHHSGFIAVDVDDLEDINHTKSLICSDPFVVSAFTSISGRGLCVLFKITPEKHREAYQGISEYLYEKYKVVTDPTSINLSRPRFVSFDPDIYIASKYKQFTRYPKSKVPKRAETPIFTNDDFGHVMNQITAQAVNLCESYQDWLRIGFGLAHQFNESGREYFHTVSQYSSKYDAAGTDKQYDACMRGRGTTEATIGSFYYYCKSAGIEIYTPRTQKIANVAIKQKRAGKSAEDIALILEETEQITGAEDIIKQVIEQDIELNKPSAWEIIATRFNTEGIYKNEVTKFCERDGKALHEQALNTIFISLAEQNPAVKGLSKQNYDLFINSENIAIKNPIRDYLDSLPSTESAEMVVKLVNSLQLKPHDQFNLYAKDVFTDPTLEFVAIILTKWLIGMIAGVYDGNYNPLMIVLIGRKNTGKTEFFRRLLPAKLKQYFAQSKFNDGKDSESLMCEKLMILNDELDGMNKNDAKTFRNFISQDFYTYRPPYGKQNVTVKRLATVCGTSNEADIINDPENNRRIIPIEITGIDYVLYNSIDLDMLFSEVNSMFKQGYTWNLTAEEIEQLDHFAKGYEANSIEREMITTLFAPGTEDDKASIALQPIEIMKQLQDYYPSAKLNVIKLGKELQTLGFKKRSLRVGVAVKKVYDCIPVTNLVKVKTPF